ncbi:hypothetical protein CDAR_57341 [Caerostris darwini]|uniref:Uncharacterized protein n=1 Tax=Caerostris darwini TaxID=1538125 RepID=A0AAV4TNE1_9ARAC|nr:hypothetical protein CDAR_57341 [Caerostris darwini]
MEYNHSSDKARGAQKGESARDMTVGGSRYDESREGARGRHHPLGCHDGRALPPIIFCQRCHRDRRAPPHVCIKTAGLQWQPESGEENLSTFPYFNIFLCCFLIILMSMSRVRRLMAVIKSRRMISFSSVMPVTGPGMGESGMECYVPTLECFYHWKEKKNGDDHSITRISKFRCNTV